MVVVDTKSIKGKKFLFFIDWINRGADYCKHKRTLDYKYTLPDGSSNNTVTEYGEGYNQAIMDVFLFFHSYKKYKELKKESVT